KGVVSLVAHYDDEPYTHVSTGAFIDTHCILTVAHALYDPNSTSNNHFPDRVDVLLDGQPFASDETFTIPQSYIDSFAQADPSHLPGSDVGIVTLSGAPAHYTFAFTTTA